MTDQAKMEAKAREWREEMQRIVREHLTAPPKFCTTNPCGVCIAHREGMEAAAKVRTKLRKQTTLAISYYEVYWYEAQDDMAAAIREKINESQ